MRPAHISDLILSPGSALALSGARVSKDGSESARCLHPSRRLLRKLLRMRSVSLTRSNAGTTRWELVRGHYCINDALPSW